MPASASALALSAACFAVAANAAKHFVPIPSIYAKKETSNLKYTVVAGDQTKDFDLKP